MLKGLKESLYQRKLKQSVQAKKKREAISFDNARNIGLLFDATKDADLKIALSYKKELQSIRKKVTLMAFKDVKQLEEEQDFPCFCNKDLSWWNLTPKKQEVLDFIHQPFDLLISLHMHDCRPLEYISAASSANFRIGHYNEEKTDFYDFMVYGKSNSLRAFLKQMETYLNKIN